MANMMHDRPPGRRGSADRSYALPRAASRSRNFASAGLRDGARRARVALGLPRDCVALLKPRVMSLVVLTALAGLLLAPAPPPTLASFVALVAIALGAGASGALNMWYDADIDAVMTRTKARPIPSGRLERKDVLFFGLTLASLSVLLLGVVANWVAAGLLAFTIFFYVVIYTMWLKRSTPLNIVIGGAAGAFPPMVGYAAATGQINLASCVLFAIIFMWTPPHFWALALVKSEDYAKAGVPMLPNVAGGDRTRVEILLYTLALAPVGALPYFLGFASLFYGAASIAGGAIFVALAVNVFRLRQGGEATKAAWRLFGFSIFYLFLLFLILVVERAATLAGWL